MNLSCRCSKSVSFFLLATSSQERAIAKVSIDMIFFIKIDSFAITIYHLPPVYAKKVFRSIVLPSNKNALTSAIKYKILSQIRLHLDDSIHKFFWYRALIVRYIGQVLSVALCHHFSVMEGRQNQFSLAIHLTFGASLNLFRLRAPNKIFTRFPAKLLANWSAQHSMRDYDAIQIHLVAKQP